MAVISQPPSPTSNSYISNADAVAVWSGDARKQDYPTVEADQDRFLRGATQLLDDVYGAAYKGDIQNADNALYWPRTGVTNPRIMRTITDFTVYPADIARATALQAYHMFKNDRQQETSDIVSANIRERLEGVGEIERGSVAQQRLAASRPAIHEEVARIMRNWVNGGTSQYSSIMVRG